MITGIETVLFGNIFYYHAFVFQKCFQFSEFVFAIHTANCRISAFEGFHQVAVTVLF